MPLKRKSRQDIPVSTVEPRSSCRRKIQQSETSHPGPLLGALPWDCASMIFDYLELLDLAHCEQVCRGWRKFVQEWMVARGYYLTLPEQWRPEFGMSQTIKEQVAMMKKSVLGYEKYRKIASGRASSARAFSGKSFDVNGEFVAWTVGTKLFGQRLGFQTHGSPYPTRCWDLRHSCDISGDTTVHVSPGGYIVARVSSHAKYLDRVVSISTGKHLWRHGHGRQDPPPEWLTIQGIGATRLYYVALEGGCKGNAYLMVHELATGDLLHRSHIRDYPQVCRPSHSFCVRRCEDRELLVALGYLPIDESAGLPSSTHVGERRLLGLLVINPVDGRTLQRFDGPFCEESYGRIMRFSILPRIIPSTEDERVFAIVCRHMTATDWVFKVERFSANADGTFHRIATDMITKDRAVGIEDEKVLDPDIDPFNGVCLDVARGCNVPRITPMEACRQSDLGDQEDIPSHAGVEVDRWLRDGSQAKITCPPKTKKDTGRRPFVLPSTRHRLWYAGANRLVVEPIRRPIYGENHVHTLLDFAFRRA